MSYLLDDKKILLKDLIFKNEKLQHDNENIELENEIFLSLIEKYETKRKVLKTIQYIHYVCSNIYEYENGISFDINRKIFFNNLKCFLNNSIFMFKKSFNCIIEKSEHERDKTKILKKSEKEGNKEKEPEIQDEEKHINSLYQNELILKNNLYDIDIEKTILQKKGRGEHEQIRTIEIPEIENENATERKTVETRNGNKAYELSVDPREKQTEDGVLGETNSDIFEIMKKIDSASCANEKQICLNWDKVEPKNNFVMTQLIKKKEENNGAVLNMKEKQQLVLNEIEKLKNEIKKISLYFENTQTIINSIVCQSKIFLFELEEERKLYEAEKEGIKNDKNLMKKSNSINDFYNKILERQKKKIDDVKKTNETLLNLYKKKFENVNYLISMNENINNVDFLYLNVLIYNKKLNYDKLIKDYEQNYSHLRNLLNEISSSEKNIKENEKKKKEIESNITKNSEIQNDMDQLIVTITNEIENVKNSSNKIGEEESIDIMNKHSILDCIQLNKDVSLLEKKIMSYKRKIETFRNVKSKK